MQTYEELTRAANKFFQPFWEAILKRFDLDFVKNDTIVALRKKISITEYGNLAQELIKRESARWDEFPDVRDVILSQLNITYGEYLYIKTHKFRWRSIDSE